MTWPGAIVEIVIGLAIIEAFFGPIEAIILATKSKKAKE